MRICISFIIILFLFLSCSQHKLIENDEVIIDRPEKLYGQLFYDVQNSDIYEFRDSKTFCDVIPKFQVGSILDSYKRLRNKADTAILKQFVQKNFLIPAYKSNFHDASDIITHINILWDTLTRGPDVIQSGTLIPLPEKYVIPGGRFREVYYWDSYFTMLGLQIDDKDEIIESMVQNFSYLIDTFGFIPNGNRTYYLSRSQPPFYSLMIDILSSVKQDHKIYLKYLYYLRKVYDFWMDGNNKLKGKNMEYHRIVRVDDSTIMNRYWDDLDIPRSEAYKEDRKIAENAKRLFGRDEKETYRNIRAAAESGWDFSSRWLRDTFNLYSIHTIDILPVDLNCLLYKLEMTLSECYELKDMQDSVVYFKQKAVQRSNAIKIYCWNNKEGYFMDYDFKEKKQTNVLSLAGMYPMFFYMTDTSMALRIAEKISKVFLKNGGVVTTNYKTGQQWDAPNGWAPLQWITYSGLKNYGINELTVTIKKRWLSLNKKVYNHTGKLVEKYNVIDTTIFGGGGEYPNQDGFGWTNGVYKILNSQ